MQCVLHCDDWDLPDLSKYLSSSSECDLWSEKDGFDKLSYVNSESNRFNFAGVDDLYAYVPFGSFLENLKYYCIYLFGDSSSLWIDDDSKSYYDFSDYSTERIRTTTTTTNMKLFSNKKPINNNLTFRQTSQCSFLWFYW